MKKLFLGLFFSCLAFVSFGQGSLTFNSTGASGSFTTGSASTTVRADGNIIVSSTTGFGGYAVFNLTGIPAGATICSATIGIYVRQAFVFGAAPTYNTYCIASDLSTVAVAATLNTDLTAGTIINNSTSYGAATATGTQVTIPSNAAGIALLQANIGSKVSICFHQTSGTSIDSIEGENGTATTTGVHAPYLTITYSLPITGTATTVCSGATINLTDALAGGVWSSTSVPTASVVAGVVTGGTVAVPTVDTIKYTLTGCPAQKYPVTVNPNPAAIVAPAVTVCTGDSIVSFTDATAGGTWSSSNAALATISNTAGTIGHVGGVGAGNPTISYTIPATGCSATKLITVNSSTPPAPISGTLTVCTSQTTPLSDITAGGTWSSSNNLIATVVAGTGVVTGVAAGTVTISYTTPGVCGSSVTAIVTVNATPSAIAPVAPSICFGTPQTMTDASLGGTWSSSSATVATIDPSFGTIFSVGSGTTNISYTVGGCAVGTTLTIIPSPSSITGSNMVCIGGTNDTLTDAVAGGTWTSSNPGAASFINVGSSGDTIVIVPGGAGNTTITYAIGTCSVTMPLTVVAAPTVGIISGPLSLCLGSTVTLFNTTPSGSWTSSNSSGAITPVTTDTILLTGTSIGIDTIYYSVSNACGLVAINSIVDTIGAPPVAGVISGPTTICAGSFALLTDTFMASSGTWTVSNVNATIDPITHIITGVSAGIDTVYYTVTTACSTAVAQKIMTILSLPDTGIIGGTNLICLGTPVSLSETAFGGSWTSTNANATVTLATGVVTGVSGGLDTIKYTVSNSCGTLFTTYPITVSPANAGTVTGSSNVCIGASIVLSDLTAPGGAWSSSNLNATITSAGGVVTGSIAGIDTITYTVINVCGTHSTTFGITVNPLPATGSILGSNQVCLGSTLSLTESLSGGKWSSSDNSIATVDSISGVITSVSAGIVNINYNVTNSFGCSAFATSVITVNALPVLTPIVGTTNECISGNTTFTEAVMGGSWTSSNAAIASIDTVSGVITGNMGGIVTITYTYTDALGCIAAVTAKDTVNILPTSTAITGIKHVCVGNSTTLHDTTLFGSWSVSNLLLANANAGTGVITGIAAGIDTVFYTVSNSCGSVIDTTTVTINGLPIINPIAGPSGVVCAGGFNVLTVAPGGGIWSSSNTIIATVNSATGTVYGLSAGMDTITYTYTNALGCSNFATTLIDFGGYISAYVTPGSATLCHGAGVSMNVVTTNTGLTYQWYSNGVALAGANSSNYYATLAGNYSVMLSNGTCSETIGGTNVSNPPVANVSFVAPNVLYTGSFAYYQWFDNGIAIPGATSSIYFETTDGSYSVLVTDGNGCSDTSSAYVITTGDAGVGTVVNNNEIKLYPNPATAVINIKAKVPVNIKVSSTDGRILINQMNATMVNVESLANGIYLLMVYDANDNLLKIEKFVKSE